MPVSEKKVWVEPTVARFSSIDELRSHYAVKATPEGLAALDRLIDQIRSDQDSSDRRPDDHLRRRFG